MTREDELNWLGGLAACFTAHAGRPPANARDLADYWELGGMYKTLDEIAEHEDPDHLNECFWLRKFAQRHDADALLAKALRLERKPYGIR